ncbi:hypothetical protein L1987_47916 [Smallanthus sonchifolius]|uniref:Uncharacterized protein n=1 Tax=Smallanthus sonchifolius TaxID=185202 RepID=A0ACB9FQH2_9ASTR|nr:hypothetical protein L1987_47916 [Smallanthus sonchifolius]
MVASLLILWLPILVAIGDILVPCYLISSFFEAENSSSVSKQRLHFKISRGMNVLFLSSVVFALGHTVIAYRTSCRARRKLMFNRVEANKLPNPYMLDTQVDMLISFCKEMGLSSVVLVGHDDGGLLALKAVQRVRSSGNSVDVKIKGVVLLTVSLSREVVPGLVRILMRTSLGKKNLVHSLLRTEISQVVNRRAWHDATKLTTDVLSLYKAPLYVEGWDESLYEIGKLSSDTVLTEENASLLVKAVEDTPVMVIAGAEDALRLVAISGCGHLPHEECPKVLLAAILPFISKLSSKADK